MIRPHPLLKSIDLHDLCPCNAQRLKLLLQHSRDLSSLPRSSCSAGGSAMPLSFVREPPMLLRQLQMDLSDRFVRRLLGHFSFLGLAQAMVIRRMIGLLHTQPPNDSTISSVMDWKP